MCGKCVGKNPDDTQYCGMCGSELAPAASRKDAQPADPSGGVEEFMELVREELADREKSLAYPAGLLTAVSGVMICITGIATLALGTMFGTMAEVDFGSLEILVYVAGAGTALLGAVIAAVGVFFVMRRRKWKVALACCVVIMLFGSVMLILGVVALVFVSLSRADFTE